ncbi:hypothetical protein IPG41_06595 [Candidatus Peregrinibacteria bacterium]|nr:MAG: hypothetical protein IPG41_06595 [Candidatus Peregrinibacteria bacterium]
MNDTRSAYSLVFAFLVMTVMMIVAGSAIQNTNEKLQLYNDLGSSSQAYLAAQSAAEAAILAIQDPDGDGVNDYSPGYESTESEAFCGNADGTTSCDSWGNFRVLAKQRGYGDYFYTPLFGTGTAGNSEECSVLDYIDPSDGEVIDALSIDVDHPCHWNKLSYGESTIIPLFDTDENGNPVLPADLAGFTGWNLRIRTPCEDGSLESGCVRFELDETNLSGPLGGDNIVAWELIGEDMDGNPVHLMTDDTLGRCGFSDCRPTSPSNTEIYEEKINNDDLVLQSTSTTEIESVTLLPNLRYLYLQLELVHPLEELNTLASIPYLEWQLEVDSGEALANAWSFVVGEGYAQGSVSLYYDTFLLFRSTTGEGSGSYSLSN